MAVHSNASKRYAVWCLPPIAVAFGPSRIGICRPRGIKRRRSQLGRQVLTELASFKPFQVAEKAATENLNFLEERMVEMPQPPTTFADVMLAQEIRAFVRHQKSPINFVINSMADRRVLGAILTAPVRLTGLKDAEWDLVRSRARQALHPEQTEMQKLLTAALDDLRGGVARSTPS